MLKAGERDKADLWVLELGGRPIVVKDFGGKAWWVRLIGRFQISREVRAYRTLGPTPGIPRLVGRVDAHAVAFERVEGEPLGHAGDRTHAGAEKLRQLRAILDRIHAAGLVHWDLRARDNVLVGRDGRVWVLDFASAVRLRPGGLAHRLLFGWLSLVDEAAYLKWKHILDGGPFTAEERRFLDRFRFWRSLWFHRRKAWRRKAKPPA